MADLEQHNKVYVKSLSEKLDGDWTLTYKAEKVHPKISIKTRSIHVINHEDNTSTKIPMGKLNSDGPTPFSDELLIEKLNLFSGPRPDQAIINNLRDDCTKIFNVEKLAQLLQAEMKTNLEIRKTPKLNI